jgi:hypothetical protein
MSTESRERELWRIATDHRQALRRCGKTSRSHARNVVVAACKSLTIQSVTMIAQEVALVLIIPITQFIWLGIEEL